MACDASFLKHYHTRVIHFGIFHFKNFCFILQRLFHDIANFSNENYMNFNTHTYIHTFFVEAGQVMGSMTANVDLL